jgi:hypothetical protein
MRVFGSLTNRIAESTVQPEPKVGMGATIIMYSDRHAATIVRVSTPRRIVIQEDKTALVGGSRMSESQEYTFEPNLKAELRTYTKRKDGVWRELADHTTTTLVIGDRDEYHDPSF